MPTHRQTATGAGIARSLELGIPGSFGRWAVQVHTPPRTGLVRVLFHRFPGFGREPVLRVMRNRLDIWSAHFYGGTGWSHIPGEVVNRLLGWDLVPRPRGHQSCGILPAMHVARPVPGGFSQDRITLPGDFYLTRTLLVATRDTQWHTGAAGKVRILQSGSWFDECDLPGNGWDLGAHLGRPCWEEPGEDEVSSDEVPAPPDYLADLPADWKATCDWGCSEEAGTEDGDDDEEPPTFQFECGCGYEWTATSTEGECRACGEWQEYSYSLD